MSRGLDDSRGSGSEPATSPRIDVLIPVFNAAATLESALASIQNQTLQAIRMVVVDDGSTDETPRILERTAAEDSRVLVVRQPNGGIVAALNMGLAACTAEFIARHDADDLASPSRLAEQLAFMDENAGCIAVGGSARHIDGEGRVLATVARFDPPEKADPARAPAREPYLLHPFMMVRRLDLVEAGGYRYVYHAEDADLYWRLQEQGALHNTPEFQGYYRMHAASISGKSIENGRLMSLYSQLAAISAMRRRSGREDLTFDRAGQERARERSESLASLHQIASEQLDPAEADHLQISMSGKLLELCGYRPYDLDRQDCKFLREAALSRWSALPREDRRYLNRMYSGTAARLLRAGRVREAMLLAFPRTWPTIIARLVVRVAFPPVVYQVMRARLLPLLTALRA